MENLKRSFIPVFDFLAQPGLSTLIMKYTLFIPICLFLSESVFAQPTIKGPDFFPNSFGPLVVGFSVTGSADGFFT